MRNFDKKHLPPEVVLWSETLWKIVETDGYRDWTNCVFVHKEDAEAYLKNLNSPYYKLEQFDFKYYGRK